MTGSVHDPLDPVGRLLFNVLTIADILRDDPFEGIGKPEPLKHALAGAWSRRIDEAHRLVYVADERYVTILQARYHY